MLDCGDYDIELESRARNPLHRLVHMCGVQLNAVTVYSHHRESWQRKEKLLEYLQLYRLHDSNTPGIRYEDVPDMVDDAARGACEIVRRMRARRWRFTWSRSVKEMEKDGSGRRGQRGKTRSSQCGSGHEQRSHEVEE